MNGTKYNQNQVICEMSTKFVKSLGGPIIIMDRPTWDIWGGSSSNSVSGFAGTDYDFVCHARGYIARTYVGNKHIVILNDMPMDTGIAENTDASLTVIRIMNGDITNLGQFFSDKKDFIFSRENEIADQSIEELSLNGDELVLVEASAMKSSARECDCLSFRLSGGVYSAKTYDYSNEAVRVIVHRFLPSPRVG